MHAKTILITPTFERKNRLENLICKQKISKKKVVFTDEIWIIEKNYKIKF